SYVLGTMDLVKAPPDGYTLGYGNIVSLAINRSLLPSLPYDVERDLTLVSNVTFVFNMLAVNNDLPVKSVAELIAYAKRNPGKLTNGSSGHGTTGPARLPTDIVQRLHKEIRAALRVPLVVERYRQLDSEIDGSTPEEFLALVRRETPKWAEVVRRSGAKVD